MAAPGYWMNEQSGVLAPVVKDYLAGLELGPEGVAAMRAYLRQWINADGFMGPDGSEVVALRRDVELIVNTSGVRSWIARAVDAGIDPL